MPLLLLLLLIGTVLYLWIARRGTTLTRNCRWRLDKAIGRNHYRCAACGAIATPPKGPPRHCLRPRPHSDRPGPP